MPVLRRSLSASRSGSLTAYGGAPTPPPTISDQQQHRHPDARHPTQPSVFHGRAGKTHRSELSPPQAPQPPRQYKAPPRRGLVRAPRETTSPTRTSPSPAPEPRPASHTGPTGPTLRANPCSEVTDPICRLPLPTLVYRPEASDLGDPMRIWVHADPNLTGNRCDPQTWSIVIKPTAPVTSEWKWGTDSHLSRAGGSTRDATRIVAFYGKPCTTTLSHSGWLSGSRRLKQKRKLFPGLPPTDASCQAKMPSVTG